MVLVPVGMQAPTPYIRRPILSVVELFQDASLLPFRRAPISHFLGSQVNGGAGKKFLFGGQCVDCAHIGQDSAGNVIVAHRLLVCNWRCTHSDMDC